MPRSGWKSLFPASSTRRPQAISPIAAYSEFMPPPRLGLLPSGREANTPFSEDDPWGWQVAEHEEAYELRPGLEHVAHQVLGALGRLVRGEPAHGLARSKLENNPYWPPDLAEHVGKLAHERLVGLMPLALSKTQDDKGRVRWTLFGGSEQGPARPFWRSFFTAPKRERPAVEAVDFLRRLLAAAYHDPAVQAGDLRSAGLRILPQGKLPAPLPDWPEGRLPRWTAPLLMSERESLRGVRYVLTFRPFGKLPAAIRRAYLAGALHLIPSPSCLIPWGVCTYTKLRDELPLATQVPLLNLVARHYGAGGVRVPQSGWMHEPRQDRPAPPDHHGAPRNTFVRTHRMARVRRDETAEPALYAREDHMAHVLFCTAENDLGLYGKPMARNVQLWTDDAQLLLDGPRATPAELEHAARTVAEGGLFGYRMQYPAMRVGETEVYWQRPLVAFFPPGAHEPAVLADAPLGYLTAYRADRPDPQHAVELWPRLLEREPYLAAIELFRRPDDPRPHQTSLDCRKLLDARATLGEPLPRSFAARMLSEPETDAVDLWLDSLPHRAGDTDRGRRLAAVLRQQLQPPEPGPDEPLTFSKTARRGFAAALEKIIAELAGGRFPNRNNADCARDPATRARLVHHRRDLEPLGDELLARHTRALSAANMNGRALVGELPFRWRTDFAFDWSEGWQASQGPDPAERDLVVVIPGRNRKRAIIMADHYDTAYMEDRYKQQGARLAARGADDNTSATAALLLAAPVLSELARAGRLGCDVWLIHLTGEEFPADCLGARHVADEVIARSMSLRLPGGRQHDLAQVEVAGAFILDMVAHENPKRPGVFQIAPGVGRASMRLALAAHHATAAWNALAAKSGRGRDAGLHPMIGQIRPHDDPRSTLYNTDGQVFSDAGIPVVLFMEDYDIDRTGYHDSHDTMAGIDRAYGAALIAIAIESVARAACAGRRSR